MTALFTTPITTVIFTCPEKNTEKLKVWVKLYSFEGKMCLRIIRFVGISRVTAGSTISVCFQESVKISVNLFWQFFVVFYNSLLNKVVSSK